MRASRDAMVQRGRSITLLVMRSLLILLCVSLATTLALANESPTTAPATAPTTRPHVFRCVLDGNPRMLVIDFRNGVMAAFDTQKCELVKVWRGDVEFTGTVYDTKHGPQPRSRGEAIAKPQLPAGRYLGYTVDEAGVTIRIEASEQRGIYLIRLHSDVVTGEVRAESTLYTPYSK